MAAYQKKQIDKANRIIKAVVKNGRKVQKEKEKEKEVVHANVTAHEIADLLNCVEPIFHAEPMLIEVPVPVHVCGDIHGQVSDLIRLFDMNKWPPETRYLFLGDYVDRGKHSSDTIAMMFALKYLYPTRFIMLRGNHETKAVNSIYGFKDELFGRFPEPVVKGEKVTQGKSLWQSFNRVFADMPLAALVHGRILCMHGGLSPHLKHLDQIRQLEKPMPTPPQEGIAIDLLWADPDKDVKGFVKSRRGVSYLFGKDAVADKCAELDIDMVARAHQVMDKGYEFFTNQLVTLFSAPDYSNEFQNHGGVMLVDANLACKMRIIPSRAREEKEKEMKAKEKRK